MNDDIEKLAKELFQIFNCAKTKTVYDNDLRWLAVAKFVKRREIMAKIEILKEILTGPDWHTTTKIKELEKELDHE